MDLSIAKDAVEAGLDGRWLLTHPFYQRWSAGELERSELAAYAGQYRAFEAAVPGLLTSLIDGLGTDGLARTLADEVGSGGAESHLALFDRFAEALGGAGAEAGPAARALVDAHRSLVQLDPALGLAGMLAYERQSAEIARTKADGLRRWYGLDEPAVAFWDVHAAADVDHAAWGLEALAAVSDDQEAVTAAVSQTAAAWWAFLDERQAAAPAV